MPFVTGGTSQVAAVHHVSVGLSVMVIGHSSGQLVRLAFHRRTSHGGSESSARDCAGIRNLVCAEALANTHVLKKEMRLK